MVFCSCAYLISLADMDTVGVVATIAALQAWFRGFEVVLDGIIPRSVLLSLNSIFQGQDPDALAFFLPFLPQGREVGLHTFVRGVKAALTPVFPNVDVLHRLYQQLLQVENELKALCRGNPANKDLETLSCKFYSLKCGLSWGLQNLKILNKESLDFAMVATSIINTLKPRTVLQSTDLCSLALACYRLARMYGLKDPHNLRIVRGHLLDVQRTTSHEDLSYIVKLPLERSDFRGGESHTTHLRTCISRLICVFNSCGLMDRGWDRTDKGLREAIFLITGFFQALEAGSLAEDPAVEDFCGERPEEDSDEEDPARDPADNGAARGGGEVPPSSPPPPPRYVPPHLRDSHRRESHRRESHRRESHGESPT